MVVTRHPRRVGQVTRGKTALNRLRRVDNYLTLALADCLYGTPLVVDLGYGAYPWTTLEMAARLSRVNPAVRCLGIEIAPERVSAAQPFASPQVQFQLGGFNVADLTGVGVVSAIRAYNVLRQYEETEVGAALNTLSRALRIGGVLIEGTSNPTGGIAVFDVYRQTADGLQHATLVFATNFNRRIAEIPSDFQTILPKRLIHHMRDEVMANFFAAWQRSYQVARAVRIEKSPAKVWCTAADRLHTEYGYPIDPRRRLIQRGFLPLHTALLPPLL